MQKKAYILDSTLRDGLQGPGYDMNLEERLALARRLKELGVYGMEIGFAGASELHREAIRQIVQTCNNGPVLSVLCRMVPSDIRLASESLEGATNGQIALFYPTMDAQLVANGKSRTDVLQLVQESIAQALPYKFSIKVYGENAMRADQQFLLEYLRTAALAGASVLSVADSSGTASPEEVAATFQRLAPLKTEFPQLLLSFHGHNDYNMAVANSAAAIQNGCDIVEGCLLGIGERAGNTAWQQIVTYLTEKELAEFPGLNTGGFYDLFWWYANLMGIPVRDNEPLFGRNSTITAAGIHMANTARFAKAYLGWEIDRYGVPQGQDVITNNVGSYFLSQEAIRLGHSLSREQLAQLLEKVKQFSEGRRQPVTDEELRTLIESIE